ncbi:hypothetical protein L1987_77129 [Smallanthus sonchifolius]|uniref:Uncharacterized protein n=1 Tax=Smallanthus sonchifolius TaxID=185202 RepID=A0ACB8Z992_9ASTR|nr:hypothetical protein L1987_77129 [Smallanthus sonchifolius]
MEEYNDLEQVTGGESGFVHVEPIDSASMDVNSINQDDGVVVTQVYSVQYEPNDVRITEDGGNEEFVDCPDDLVSYDGMTGFDETQKSELVPEVQQTFGDDTEILPHHYQEERRQLLTELINLRHQLKNLTDKQSLIGGNDGALLTDELTSALPLHDIINDCFRCIELGLSEWSQTEGTIRNLYATLDTKDREIENLNVKFSDLAHKNSYLEIEYWKQMEKLEKSRETIEMLSSDIEKLKGEVEIQKTRFINTKGKLNLAVTKGKSLVQQRDSLKQVIVEKTSELDKCLIELQEKSSALVAANSLKEALLQRDMVIEKCEEILSSSSVGDELQSSDIVDRITWLVNERNRLTLISIEFQKIADALWSLELPEAAQYPDLESGVKWPLGSLNFAKYESFRLQDEINMTKEAACAEIDRLTISLLVEAQEKNYLEDELAKISDEICELKDKKGSLQNDLQRFEDKAAILREKLSMAVKKGKGLVQERESLKQQLAEKNAQNEALYLELKQQEAIINDCRDQICKLEYGLVRSKEERDQIEQFLIESNMMLQRVTKATDDISLPVDLIDPVEKVKWCAAYFDECQVAKVKSEQELTDVLTTVRSLEDALSVSEQYVLQLTEEKRELEILKVNTEEKLHKVLENEIKKLKEEATFHEDTISDLVEEKKNYEQEISTLNSQLSACKQELACKNENYHFYLSSFLENLQVLLKDGTLLSLFKQSFEKKIDFFMKINHYLKDVKDYFDSEQLQSYPAIEESFQLSTLLPVDFDNVLNIETSDGNLANAKDIGSYVDKTSEKLNLRNQILADEFVRLSSFTDELTASFLIKLEGIRNSVPFMVEQNETLLKNINSLQIDKQAQEKDFKVLLSACADVTKELKFLAENNILDKLNYNVSSDVGEVDEAVIADLKVTEEMLCAARNVRSVIEHCVDVKQNMSTEFKELQAELDNTRSMCENVKEENKIFQNRVSKLETEIKDKHAEWITREAELSKQTTAFLKDHEAKNDIMSSSEVKALFNKIDGIKTPFPSITTGGREAYDSDPIKKLFYIVDGVNKLLDEITMLSQSKEELHSNLSKQALEVEHLKEELEETIKDKKHFEKMQKDLFELSIGLERIIRKFGGDEDKKSADVAGLLPVLDRLVDSIVLDGENSKSEAQELGVKLLETQKLAEELEKKVKLLEDFNQNQACLHETSETSEVEDLGSVGKRSTPLVTYAAHVRTLRRESNDHLALNIDPESDRLIDEHETAEDKGHIFKSLHTSGLVPVHGKVIADRLDGIWVSGGRALMSRPRARLGLIAYCLFLHLWLIGTIL